MWYSWPRRIGRGTPEIDILEGRKHKAELMASLRRRACNLPPSRTIVYLNDTADELTTFNLSTMVPNAYYGIVVYVSFSCLSSR
ncbi:hypothetical protein L208DRAFT_887767 [Tricholoma matsutake]|nr:hypothetical protein L208DRAFT_887767 [Tricholoma matsutake 945]